MIPTNDGIYVDECDPLFRTLRASLGWDAVKRAVGRGLNRLFAPHYLVISSTDDDPDYPAIREEIQAACRRLNEKD